MRKAEADNAGSFAFLMESLTPAARFRLNLAIEMGSPT